MVSYVWREIGNINYLQVIAIEGLALWAILGEWMFPNVWKKKTKQQKHLHYLSIIVIHDLVTKKGFANECSIMLKEKWETPML